jgi:predicted homoserine dehydrogenase-like protein
MYERLRAHEAAGRAITVAATGAGWMGSGFVAAVRRVPGMRIGVLADPDTGAARAALETEGGLARGDIVETSRVGEAADAIAAGKTVVTGEPEIGAALDVVDIVTDVTPHAESGARTARAAIEHGKDVVLINIETDVTVGTELKRRAETAGVLYSVSSGDEPGCLMELWDFVLSLGYEPVVIGKGKNNPLQIEATPDTVREAAAKADKDPYQIASYVDGTKTMFELGCVANATGCRPMQPGMTGPQADLSTVSQIFSLARDGGTVPAPGVVDYVQGSAMSGGVFVTVRVTDRRVQKDLNYLKVGSGSYFTFFRPYHLWFLEAPISLARAYFDRRPTLVPRDPPTADVVAVAKRALRAGESIDAIGGYDVRGLLMTGDDARDAQALPVALAPGARVTADVAAGETVRRGAVEVDASLVLAELREAQDGRATARPGKGGTP